MKDFIVEFGPNGARIYKSQEDIVRLYGQPNTLINPVLPAGVPPHRWRLENGAIVTTPGPLLTPVKKIKSKRYLIHAAIFVAGLLIGHYVPRFFS